MTTPTRSSPTPTKNKVAPPFAPLSTAGVTVAVNGVFTGSFVASGVADGMPGCGVFVGLNVPSGNAVAVGEAVRVAVAVPVEDAPVPAVGEGVSCDVTAGVGDAGVDVTPGVSVVAGLVDGTGVVETVEVGVAGGGSGGRVVGGGGVVGTGDGVRVGTVQ